MNLVEQRSGRHRLTVEFEVDDRNGAVVDGDDYASSEGQVVAEAFRRERLRDNLSRLIDSDDDVEAVAIKLGAQHPDGLSHCRT